MNLSGHLYNQFLLHSAALTKRAEDIQERDMRDLTLLALAQIPKAPLIQMALPQMNAMLQKVIETNPEITNRSVFETSRLPFDECTIWVEGMMGAFLKSTNGQLVAGCILGRTRDDAYYTFPFEIKQGFLFGHSVWAQRGRETLMLPATESHHFYKAQRGDPQTDLAQLCSTFLHQNHFAVEQAGEPQSRQERRSGRPATFAQRTRIILLSAEEIVRRQYQKREDSDVTSEILARTPHCRRGHWRTYHHERYSAEKREKPQWIKAHWVGSDEWQEGQVRYKVRLDL